MKLLRVSEVLWEGYVRTETTLLRGLNQSRERRASARNGVGMGCVGGPVRS